MTTAVSPRESPGASPPAARQQLTRSVSYQALLSLSDAIWYRPHVGPLPDPGSQVELHGDLPAGTVIGVSAATSTAAAAVLVRPGGSAPHPEHLLRAAGWTPLIPEARTG